MCLNFDLSRSWDHLRRRQRRLLGHLQDVAAARGERPRAVPAERDERRGDGDGKYLDVLGLQNKEKTNRDSGAEGNERIVSFVKMAIAIDRHTSRPSGCPLIFLLAHRSRSQTNKHSSTLRT